MAAWTDITASGSFMRAGNEDVFNTNIDGDLTTGSAVIADTETSDLATGMIVNGVGIPTDSVILSFDASASTVTIDGNATETNKRVTLEYQTTSDAQLAALDKTNSKLIMYQDLWMAFSNDPDQSELIDDLADTNTDYLNMVLGWLQLCRYYEGNRNGDESENDIRRIRYCNKYSDAKSGFANLKQSDKATQLTGRFII